MPEHIPLHDPTLPMSPANSIPINGLFSWLQDGDMTYYFQNLQPYDCHPSDKPQAMKLRVARLCRVAHIRFTDLVNAFPLSASTIERAIKLYDDEGEDAFVGERRGQGRARSVVTPQLAERAQQLLNEGKSIRACAAQLGIASSTLHENKRAGIIGGDTKPPRDESEEQAPASERCARNSRDLQPAAGRACHDAERRMLTSTGLMEAATPQFKVPAQAVQRAGVLAALPMLLKEGLLSSVQGLLKLPAGFYGLSSILLFMAFMTLARVRNPDALHHHAPGEWGQVLGLDRCPEVKTLRRKLGQLAESPHTVNQWQQRLARDWLAQHEDDEWLTLAVDGHVKVYSGRQGKLPKHFVSRQKLCLPASTSCWVNALGGAPVMCLHQDLDPKMVQVLKQVIVPQLQELGVVTEDAPNLRNATSGKPAVTLVFDREGWSPDLFSKLARQGVAVITWQKNLSGQDWPHSDFESCEVPIHGPVNTSTSTVRLAEKRIRLRNGLQVRQIRSLSDSDRQMPMVTTHPSMPMTEVAGAMLSRWNQENFFKYMKLNYNLDALAEYALAELDPDQQVVNPDYRELQKIIDRVSKCRQRRIVAAHDKDDASLTAEIDQLSDELVQLKAQRKKLDSHVRAGDLPDQLRPQALPPARRLVLDIVRMLCYRAETRMMPWLGSEKATLPDARKRLAALLTADANMVPDHQQGLLRVQLLGSASNAADQAYLPLFDELNRTQTIYPGTDLILFYELAS